MCGGTRPNYSTSQFLCTFGGQACRALRGKVVSAKVKLSGILITFSLMRIAVTVRRSERSLRIGALETTERVLCAAVAQSPGSPSPTEQYSCIGARGGVECRPRSITQAAATVPLRRMHPQPRATFVCTRWKLASLNWFARAPPPARRACRALSAPPPLPASRSSL